MNDFDGKRVINCTRLQTLHQHATHSLPRVRPKWAYQFGRREPVELWHVSALSNTAEQQAVVRLSSMNALVLLESDRIRLCTLCD
jgi:hypothetical protein